MPLRGRKSPRRAASAPIRGVLRTWITTLALAFSAASASPSPPYLTHQVSGATVDARLTLLQRTAPSGTPRFRLAFIPGSGCSGLAPVAARLFAGLYNAEVWIVHKPGVNVMAGPTPGSCPPGFVANDDLAQWLQHARVAITWVRAHTQSHASVPWLLLGVSEGAELLPFLAPELPELRGVIMVGGSGLDPVEAGALQAQALGEVREWQDLALAQASARRPDSELMDGRTLRYWRSMWAWRNAEAALALDVPLVQIHGTHDQAVPVSTYHRFAERARRKGAGFCTWAIEGADHGLQGPRGDGYQALWSVLEQWSLAPEHGLCSVTKQLLGNAISH